MCFFALEFLGTGLDSNQQRRNYNFAVLGHLSSQCKKEAVALKQPPHSNVFPTISGWDHPDLIGSLTRLRLPLWLGSAFVL